jgi:hypothetical protein
MDGKRYIPFFCAGKPLCAFRQGFPPYREGNFLPKDGYQAGLIIPPRAGASTGKEPDYRRFFR